MFREGFGKEGDLVCFRFFDDAEPTITPSAVIDQVSLRNEEGEKENRVKNTPNHVIFPIYFNGFIAILGILFFWQGYIWRIYDLQISDRGERLERAPRERWIS